MKVKYIKKLMISGISITTNNTNEMNEETQKIAPLWEQYDKENIYTKTFNKSNDSSFYGVYSNYTSDLNGDYDVTVGVEVTKPKNAIVIEDERYLVFTKQGELPEVAFKAWEEIWDYFANNSEYERKYTTDFEKYSKEDEIEIYISIK
ncbi:MAG: GyrI-like domain-containing protein [Arcobacteraceae bacterium]|nr:GyrI-like domain-containing protein [Arcobacteraceae bacterium]